MISILCGCHISFWHFIILEVVMGHDFWTHLKMCMESLDLLTLIWSNQNVIDEMGSYVALMPMVMKFGSID